jgi:PIN domain nuclease of toxin-antitoxin system
MGMNYILDTQAFLWLVTGAREMPARLRRELDADGERIGVPAAVPIELAVKERIGRLQPQRKDGLRFPVPYREWIALALPPDKFELLPILPEVAAEAFDLPGDFHKDPFDCLIVATARLHGVPLVTSDQAIQEYPHVQTHPFTPIRV